MTYVLCLRSLISVLGKKLCKKKKKTEKVVDKSEKVCIIVRVENNSGPLVKGLRHRLFTAVTRVRIPYGLWYVADGTLDEKRLKKFQKSVDKRKHL